MAGVRHRAGSLVVRWSEPWVAWPGIEPHFSASSAIKGRHMERDRQGESSRGEDNSK